MEFCQVFELTTTPFVLGAIDFREGGGVVWILALPLKSLNLWDASHSH
jgi:hypothetical protein